MGTGNHSTGSGVISAGSDIIISGIPGFCIFSTLEVTESVG